MGKAPAFQFYPKDWLSDASVRMCSPATRGIWIDCLCLMWDAPEKGILSGTPERLARSLGLSREEFQNFLDEAKETNLADIVIENDVTACHGASHQCHAVVTIINRRMSREQKVKDSARIRKKNQREREKSQAGHATCHAEVTPPSSSSSSTAKKERNKHSACAREPAPPDSQSEPPNPAQSAELELEQAGIEPYSLEFLEFWEAYPNKVGQDDAWIAWKELKKKRQHPGIGTFHTALLAQGKSARWQQNGGQYIPDPANWLKKRRWKDKLPEACVTHDVTAMSRGQSRDGLVPKTFAQHQAAEQEDQALIALEYMRGQNDAKQKCNSGRTGEILLGLPTS
ncbi:hypothetical protein [Desulfovibrio inopinatus]|uniref:hypothetical protein n=1 Tax=Desulfovibrio inopinatus TaxID=102109 RepID=UPI0003FB5E0F|nr:hypothetical protein [Desulfovibrio inopinatus]